MKYDVIGDIHGCYQELTTLIEKLGYQVSRNDTYHPDGRSLVFLGDLTDRGPESLKVIELVHLLIEQGMAKYSPGNHCDKLYRYFLGRNVQIRHGLETTVEEYEQLNDQEQSEISTKFKWLFENAPLYLRLDQDRLIVAHAGIRDDLIGHSHKRVRTFVLYGDITGEYHDNGMPIRRDWAKQYGGESIIVYGHTPVKEPRRVGNTINIDTGCVFGGSLTAYQYPENTTVSVPSTMPYVNEKFRPFDD
ncbi:bis(5'-nucleosyl)-tetraphosphatase PrpE [Pseudalkalibacillus berkeleyi]|uniref:Bis(5'-nucleosyl)-tetraphosphatase PrpE n=1 Tax=Pseudalkalibacillus berkeleyi TaxID=1069813 RepID=A0ABS9GZE9_9BACL|nr:bis(5'-nucleosyl)-tetraphosphatase PrpE [Pseudalkalibacillus berkeleyi]MCF6136868.1 bis(5'-nucleosyl)-tetraphosphatase PrpE [Pseudalkalibacillus berkeleyi]